MSSDTVVASAVPVIGGSTGASTGASAIIYIPDEVRQKLEAGGRMQVLFYLDVRAVRIAEDPDCSINA